MLGVAAVVDEAVAAIRHCMPPQAAVGPPLRSLSRLLDPVEFDALSIDATCATFDFTTLSVRTDSLDRDLGIGAFESVVIHCSFGSRRLLFILGLITQFVRSVAFTKYPFDCLHLDLQLCF